MKDYEDEAFDELEKAQQRKVATGVTDGSKVTIDRAKLEQVRKALEMSIKQPVWGHPETELAIKVIDEALEDV